MTVKDQEFMLMPVRTFAKILTIGASLAAAPAFATGGGDYWLWDFTQSESPLTGGDSNGFGNTLSMNRDGVNLTVSGWSDTKGTTSETNTPAERIDETRMIYYGGGNSLGMQNHDEGTDTPNHSIDSYDPASPNESWGNDFDAALLTFDTAVNLSHVGMQWARENYGEAGDDTVADISVLAWTDANDFTGFDSSTDTWSSILGGGIGQGFDVIDNYSNVSAYSYQAVSTSVLSKYWLVSIYNPVFGENWTSRNDGFKLSGVKTSHQPPPPGVPSPGSLALMLIGVLGLRASRRKQPESLAA